MTREDDNGLPKPEPVDGMTRPVADHIHACRMLGAADLEIVLGAIRSLRIEIIELKDKLDDRIDRAANDVADAVRRAIDLSGAGVLAEVQAQRQEVSADVLMEAATIRRLILTSGHPVEVVHRPPPPKADDTIKRHG